MLPVNLLLLLQCKQKSSRNQYILIISIKQTTGSTAVLKAERFEAVTKSPFGPWTVTYIKDPETSPKLLVSYVYDDVANLGDITFVTSFLPPPFVFGVTLALPQEAKDETVYDHVFVSYGLFGHPGFDGKGGGYVSLSSSSALLHASLHASLQTSSNVLTLLIATLYTL